MPAIRHHRQRERRAGNPGYEGRLNEALEAVSSGVAPSLRKAARSKGVSKSTLCDRAKGLHKSIKAASHARQLLSPAEEQVLVEWCRLRAQEARPWSAHELRQYAEHISGKTVGRNWTRRFEKRHPELCSARPAKLDPKRANNFNETVVGDFYDKMQALEERYGEIPPEHWWNEDEKGVQMGGGRKNIGKKFFFMKDQKNRYRLGSDNLELVTIMECVSAAGDIIPPSFVLSEGPIPDLRHDLEVEDFGSLYTSANGWSDNDHCQKWFKDVFIPNAKSRMVDRTKPIILIMDGHGSHETLDMEKTAYQEMQEEGIEIIIFCFPSKCTHKMQPLDVVIFSAVQKRWQKVAEKCVFDRVAVDRYNVIPLYIKGTREVMTKELIQAAFRKTGIYPCDRNVFTDEDFAPSRVTSIIPHVPPSYPIDFPSSDPIEIDEDWAQNSEDGESDNTDDTQSRCSDTDDIDYTMVDEETAGEESSDDNSSDSSDSESDSQSDSESNIIDNGPTPSTLSNSTTCPKSGFMIALGNIEERVGKVLTRSTSIQSSTLSRRSNPPPIVSLFDDSCRTQQELLDELRHVRQELSNTWLAYTQAVTELGAAEAHCTIIRREVGILRADLDNATKPRTRRGKTKTKARFVTSRELFATFNEREAAELKNKRLADEKSKEKANKLAQAKDQISQDAVSRTFTGRIRSYKKGDLQALARALQLHEDGTVEVLRDRIEQYINGPAKEQIEKNPRFAGLYHTGKTSSARPHHHQSQSSQPPVPDNTDPGPSSNNTAQQIPQPVIPPHPSHPSSMVTHYHPHPSFTAHHPSYNQIPPFQMSYSSYPSPYRYFPPEFVQSSSGPSSMLTRHDNTTQDHSTN